jgi:hypothetical protein
VGGGLKMGQVIGATTRWGERAAGRPYTPKNLLATLYADVLGIDPATTLPALDGRPMYVLDDRETTPSWCRIKAGNAPQMPSALSYCVTPRRAHFATAFTQVREQIA